MEDDTRSLLKRLPQRQLVYPFTEIQYPAAQTNSEIVQHPVDLEFFQEECKPTQ
jgi:hypothetical protein